MISSEKNLYLQKTEVTPNRYALIVMGMMVGGLLFCWVLTEIGVFRVGLTEMRLGVLAPTALILPFLLYVLFHKKILESPSTKWIIFAIFTLLTVSVTTLMNFHTTLMLLVPVMLAMLYRSSAFGLASAVSSSLCTVISPILGYVLHTWDIPLLEELILIGTGVSPQIVDPTYSITWLNIGKIVLYLVLPRMIMIVSCSLLMFYVIRVGEKQIANEILLDAINRRDTLTGLYNQNYYKHVLETNQDTGSVGIIFFDVNGLKAANDEFGHERGDLLLKRCALSLRMMCDGSTTFGFRLGGDEFMLIIKGATQDNIREKLRLWSDNLDKVNAENREKYDGIVCSMAAGAACGTFDKLEEVVKRADGLMYENKVKMKAVR